MPSTPGQVLLLILLGLPGVTWLAWRERRLPRQLKSTLRETVEFFAVSALASIVGLLLSLWLWEATSSFSGRAALADFGAYYRREPPLTLSWLATGVGLAIALTAGAAFLSARFQRRPKHRDNLTPWHYVFHQHKWTQGTDPDGLPENPSPNGDVLTLCQMDDGTQIAGLCVAYSDDPQLEGRRDLVLYGPTMTVPAPTEGSAVADALSYNLLIVNEQRIRWWAVKPITAEAAARYRDVIKEARKARRLQKGRAQRS